MEFDDTNERAQKRAAKRVVKVLNKFQVPSHVETDEHKKEILWKIRRSASAFVGHTETNARALPLIEDGIVPIERFKEYIEAVYALFERFGLQSAIWGHAGNANLHLQPLLDLSQVGDRQKVFKLLEEYYELVIGLGGSTTAEHGDGRLRGPFLPKLYGPEMYALFEKTKKIFDPYGTLNPGVKTGVDIEQIKPLLRHEYSIGHLLDHMPNS
jgi:FAD/FMN-containing dehydrogenase